LKTDMDFGEEGGDSGCFEAQPIEPGIGYLGVRAAIGVGCNLRDLPPFPGGLDFERDLDACGRAAGGGVQDVGGESSLCSRRRVICRCCSAAARISAAGSFCIRRLRIASISAAVFPVAHTM
jgi:hypothetical protein